MRRLLEKFGLLSRPSPLLLQNRGHFTAFDQTRPLTDYRFVVLDTELTGLGRRDEIISIGRCGSATCRSNWGRPLIVWSGR